MQVSNSLIIGLSFAGFVVLSCFTYWCCCATKPVQKKRRVQYNQVIAVDII